MNTTKLLASLLRENDLLQLATAIPHKYLRDEAALVVLKWPAYRFQSPMRLNRMFRDTYNAICWPRRLRSSEGKWSPVGGIGGKLDFGKPGSQLTQLHVARQRADSLGMPYDDYIRFCFDFADRRKRDFIPRPNQLAPSEQAREAWFGMLRAYWTEDLIWVRLRLPSGLEIYDVRNNLGLPAQATFRAEILRLAQCQVTNPATFYGLTVLERCWLHPKELVATDPTTWERARTLAEGDDRAGGFVAVPHIIPGDTKLQQCCFGLPGVDTATDETCRTCPARKACNLLRDNITGKVRDRHGCDNPLEKARKHKNKERVRRCRAAKIAGSSSSLVSPSPKQRA